MKYATIVSLYLGTAMVGLAMLSTPAMADGEKACDSMTLYGPPEHREAHFIDMQGDGLSVGDRRIGQRGVFNEAGERVADRVWSMTVLEVGDDGEASLTAVENMTIFEDGVLFATFGNRMAVDTANPDVTHFPSSGTAHTIIGGTGAYAGAIGTLETVQEGTDFAYVITLVCD